MTSGTRVLRRQRYADGGTGFHPLFGLRPDSTSSVACPVVGAATAHDALRDDFDTSYLDGNDAYKGVSPTWSGGVDDVTGLTSIASFTVTVRAAITGTVFVPAALIVVPVISGVTILYNGGPLSGSQMVITDAGVTRDYLFATYTKSGGDSFTAAQINGMALVASSGSNGKLFAVAVVCS